MVKDKIHLLLQKKGGAISELHTYLDHVKEDNTLRRAVGPVVLKNALKDLTGTWLWLLLLLLLSLLLLLLLLLLLPLLLLCNALATLWDTMGSDHLGRVSLDHWTPSLLIC